MVHTQFHFFCKQYIYLNTRIRRYHSTVYPQSQQQQQQLQRGCIWGHYSDSQCLHIIIPPCLPFLLAHLPGFVQTDTCHVWRIGSLRNKCLILCGLFTFNGRVGWEKHLICAHTRRDVWGHRNTGGNAPGCSFEINLSEAHSFTTLYGGAQLC